MAFMKRLSGVVQAKANKVLDRVEDPRETLDLSYEKQVEQLTQVRRGVADVATARRRIEIQAQQLQSSANKLQDQARQAMAQNREDLAREALGRRASIGSQLEGLKAQHDQLVDQEDKLVATTHALEARVEAFRTQKETLKASYTAAQAQTNIGEAVSGISESMSDTGMAVQRAQDRISQMQARAGAVDELLASGALNDLSGSSDPLQAELDKTSRANQVELELAQLKGGALPAGTPTSGQLPASAAQDNAAQDNTVTDVNVDDEPAEAETIPPTAAPAEPKDLFSLDGGERRVIVRILGEGQFELPESTKARLDELDAVVERAVAANDEATFRPALWGLLTVIREEGTPLDPTRIVPSDLAVPGADASLHEVHELLASEATADN